MPRRSRLVSPAALIRTRATSKGLLGGDPLWRTIWVVLFGGRFLRRTLGRQPELLIDEPLQPGETMVIETIPALARSERKAAAKAAKVRDAKRRRRAERVRQVEEARVELSRRARRAEKRAHKAARKVRRAAKRARRSR